ncbi:hypothetical protein CBFG_00023 [Clostridiales bacterium 1_7_47FAA]|nr:hypothetical protein CBFG_00023 [Clostridiales bacterium 1_7_47FAA]
MNLDSGIGSHAEVIPSPVHKSYLKDISYSKYISYSKDISYPKYTFYPKYTSYLKYASYLEYASSPDYIPRAFIYSSVFCVCSGWNAQPAKRARAGRTGAGWRHSGGGRSFLGPGGLKDGGGFLHQSKNPRCSERRKSFRIST